jgi:hypothetical protein
MVWFILILIIVGYVIWKFNDDSKKVARRNESFGGMKKMFPEFVEYFENNGFELVENSGAKLIYKKTLTDKPHAGASFQLVPFASRRCLLVAIRSYLIQVHNHLKSSR